jgi:hypothetical protein
VITTKQGVLPRFELFRSAEPAMVPENTIPSFLSDERLGTNNLIQISNIDQDLYHVYLEILNVTKFLDHYERLPKKTWLLHLMILDRNAAQYHLIALATSQLPISDFSDDPNRPKVANLALSELLRLAACIYNDMVVFPMAASTGVKPRLVARMRQIITASHLYSHILHSQDQIGNELHIWLLWFGCFGALATKHQAWFERQLRFTLLAIDRDVCQEAYETVFDRFLCRFLWWDPVCGPPARDLWGRIQALHDAGRSSVFLGTLESPSQEPQALVDWSKRANLS